MGRARKVSFSIGKIQPVASRNNYQLPVTTYHRHELCSYGTVDTEREIVYRERERSHFGVAGLA